MRFLKKLFAPPAEPEKRYYNFIVKSKRCGEWIKGDVNWDNDPCAEYEDSGDVYYVRKALIGESRRFQRVETAFNFMPERTLIARQVTGGEFVSQAE